MLRMKRKLLFMITSVFILTAAGTVSASSLICEGKIKKIKVFSDGFFLVWGQGEWIPGAHRLCKMDGTWQSIGMETCKSYQSILQQALATGSIIRIEYKNLVGVSTCQDLPRWGNSIKPHGIEVE